MIAGHGNLSNKMQQIEKQLQEKISQYLANYFQVEIEVWSQDHSRRIDIVLVHKSDIKKEYPIGIEIKTDDKKTGSSLGQWLHQANDYTLRQFNGYGKLLIITYPQISGKCLAEGMLMHFHNVFESGSLALQHNVNTFLGQFNIGELQKYQFNDKTYLRIVFNARLIWDHRKNEFRTDNYILSCKR